MWLSGIYSFLFRRDGESDKNVTVLVDTERGRGTYSRIKVCGDFGVVVYIVAVLAPSASDLPVLPAPHSHQP
jgi:hypothetical protein